MRLVPILGALVELGPQSRLGLTVRFPSLRLGGTTTTYLAEASSFVDQAPDELPGLEGLNLRIN